MQSDWNLPTAPVQLTTKVESSPADLRQTPDWQSSQRRLRGGPLLPRNRSMMPEMGIFLTHPVWS